LCGFLDEDEEEPLHVIVKEVFKNSHRRCVVLCNPVVNETPQELPEGDEEEITYVIDTELHKMIKAAGPSQAAGVELHGEPEA